MTELSNYGMAELNAEIQRRKDAYRLSKARTCRRCGGPIEDQGGDMPVPDWRHTLSGSRYCFTSKAEPTE